MTENPLRPLKRIGTLVAVAAVLAASSALAAGQTPRPVNPITSINADKGSDDETRPFASLDEEMRAKRAIKSADDAYQENLSRARDLSFIGTSVFSKFKQKNYLDREDLKKLEKAEKLARSIRSAAGGSEDDVKMEKPPTDAASALSMFADLTESLKCKVEKTPKHVISAAVIDEANVLLELIRIIRAFPSKA